ncbi:hypothetical protein L596_007864 [Steinernema carpocapsae]|uniref:Uncharacterized protein n=1 Tax=Steinernema carpocapsae TaxID=34508 RepID=A0A4U5PAS3_STECR|nr:hypothetical protein L596_007864 [Steinernema carpocapsae]
MKTFSCLANYPDSRDLDGSDTFRKQRICEPGEKRITVASQFKHECSCSANLPQEFLGMRDNVLIVDPCLIFSFSFTQIRTSGPNVLLLAYHSLSTQRHLLPGSRTPTITS